MILKQHWTPTRLYSNTILVWRDWFYGGRWILTRARACCRWGLVCVGTVRLLPAVSCVALFTRTFARVSAATLRVDLGVRQVHHIRHLRHTNTCHYRVTSQTLTRTHAATHNNDKRGWTNWTTERHHTNIIIHPDTQKWYNTTQTHRSANWRSKQQKNHTTLMGETILYDVTTRTMRRHFMSCTKAELTPRFQTTRLNKLRLTEPVKGYFHSYNHPFAKLESSY